MMTVMLGGDLDVATRVRVSVRVSVRCFVVRVWVRLRLRLRLRDAVRLFMKEKIGLELGVGLDKM